ncbi:MAG: hypothetical protein AAGD96_21405, partial [Chloroflexota bacterium]
DINRETCRDNPDKNTCYDISTDAVSVHINCRFSSDGEEMFLAQVDVEELDNIDLAEVINNVFKTPLTVGEVACRFNLLDEYGNMTSVEDSPIVTFQLDSENEDQLAQPIITGVNTQIDGEDYKLEVFWDIPASPVIHSFRLERENSDGSVHNIDNIDPVDRSVLDDGPDIAVGEVYTFSLYADHLYDFASNTVSEPRRHRLYGGEERPLFDVIWNDPYPTYLAGTGTFLNLQSPIDDVNHFAVFRSTKIDGDYTQITPVLHTTGQIILYTDASAQNRCYYYQVVIFDVRTGEPYGYSEPRTPQICLTAAVDIYELGLDIPAEPFPDPACTPAAHANPPAYPFVFGGGFEVQLENLDAGAGPADVGGGGWVQLETADETLSIPVVFDNLTVDAAGRVCSGSVSVNFDSFSNGYVRLQEDGGMPYRLYWLQLLPWFTSDHSLSTIEIELPDSVLTADDNGLESTELELTDVQITRSLRFNHTFDPTQSQTHSCTTPDVAFRLETLPLDVIPNGPVKFNSNGIGMNDSCTQYVDRYNNSDAASTVVNAPYSGLPQTHLHNDGYLRTSYTGVKTSITSAGLNGHFSTTGELDWTAAYPYLTRITIGDGLAIQLQGSQILAGTGANGTIEMRYHQTVDGDQIGTFPGSFSAIELGPQGDLVADVSTTSNVDWDAFSMPHSADWMLFTGPITSRYQPALDAADAQLEGIERTIMWRIRPDGSTPVNFDGGSMQGYLEPGLNRRVTEQSLGWANCGDNHVFNNVAMDTYLRHGGISQQYVPLFDENESMTVHGYEFLVERFDLQFLDNGLYSSDISGWVNLPFPANTQIYLVDIWLTGDLNKGGDEESSCIGGGRIPEGEQLHNLDFWDIDTRFSSAEFRQVINNPTRLWLLGDIRNLPHLKVGNDSAIIPAELSFLPNGNFNDDPASGPKYDRADYTFQGFPYLLEQFRPSDWYSEGNGEQPVWTNSATIAANPGAAAWNAEGFVGLRGGLIAPYYGPMIIEAANESADQMIIAAWDANLTGFASQPRVEKEWIKVARTSINFNYDRLVHAYDSQSDSGLMVGFRAYRFVPDRFAELSGTVLPTLDELDLDIIPNEGEKAQNARRLKRLQVLQLDTATVIQPAETNVFLGLSSGVAAFQAFANSQQIDRASADNMTQWGNKLDIDSGVRNVYVSQYNNVHDSEGSFNFKQTTDVLDNLSLELLLDEKNVGGRTQGLLAERGINFRRLRGVIEREGTGLDVQFAKFHVSMEVDLRGKDQDPNSPPELSPKPFEDDEPPMFYAERMTLRIDRHGEFLVQGENV